MAKNLVIVESPAKAKTLKKFLGNTYKIEASVGHVRDLPKSELGIDVENDFEPKYITIRGKGELLSKLRKEAKNSDKIYLATDPDREGEAISWHLMHALKLDPKNAFRITFNEITKNAVKRSIKEAREIDMNLVDAQQARRGLDRIVGYKISPLLWKKIRKGLSAGRVQSVALKMICDREEEIENFTPTEYWSIEAELACGSRKSGSQKEEKISARFAGSDQEKNEKIELNNEAQVGKIVSEIKKEKFIVTDVKNGTRTRKPVAPFTTSTLQQEASKIFNFPTSKTMLIAQQLYEGVDIEGEGTVGLVSYIRTDSMRISDEAYEDVKAYILENYGKEYANDVKTEHKSKNKTQDAHEAIRPTATFREPESVKSSLGRDQYKLYRLIWERFVASQMSVAEFETRSVKINAGKYVFRASGSVMKFDGYLKVYKKNEESKDEDVKMPDLTVGSELTAVSVEGLQHFTQAPARFIEANLVKSMEELGIGRPSTYSATITNILQRRYVTRENKFLFPTELGEIVNDIMKNNFNEVVSIDFTARMEEDLDRVAEGDLEWKEILRQFYMPFSEKIKIAEEKIGHIEVADEETDIKCDNCGRNMVIKLGRFGKFLACPGFPECRNTKPFFEEADVNCPLCQGKVLIKKTKKGRKYYGCENNPDCGFMSWSRPTGDNCPECGAYLIFKGTRKPKIACSDSKCGFSKDQEEE